MQLSCNIILVQELENRYSEVIPLASLALAEGVIETIDFLEPKLVDGFKSYHWLMGSNPRDEMVSVLSMYTPGTIWQKRLN